MSTGSSEPEVHVVASAAARSRKARWWRGFTGSLAAGLVALAVIVLGTGLVCLLAGVPGPGAALLIGQPVAAVVALVAQRVADRRQGMSAAFAGIVVLADVVAALWLFWRD
jgi:uncharacterized membrane protein YecN with MAPEG domain